MRSPRAVLQNRRGQATILVLVVAAAGIAGVTSHPFGAKAGSGPTLSATSFQALNDPATLVAGVPDATRILGIGYTPAAGQVHAVGDGAYAWTSGSQTCWAIAHFSGCLDPLAQPIDWSVGDADVAGSGAPTQVFGLAVDSVNGVAVTLDDGRQLTAKPVKNFFTISLPAADGPSDVISIEATFGTNGRYTAPVNIAKASQP
jgi:hypothetical protein